MTKYLYKAYFKNNEDNSDSVLCNRNALNQAIKELVEISRATKKGATVKIWMTLPRVVERMYLSFLPVMKFLMQFRHPCGPVQWRSLCSLTAKTACAVQFNS
jgi:hypothetical protein